MYKDIDLPFLPMWRFCYQINRQKILPLRTLTRGNATAFVCRSSDGKMR